MNDKMRSSVMGLILSLFSSPLPEVQKQNTDNENSEDGEKE